MTHHRRPCALGRGVLAGLIAAGLLAAISPASATTLRKMDLPELIASADRIVHVRAINQNVYWDPTETQIYTDTTFEVLSEAKGQGPSLVTVNLLGGSIGEVDMRAEGTPIFSAGDEVVLFALDRPDGKEDLVGFSQGVMRVVTETSTGATGEAVSMKFAVSEVPLGVTYVQVGGPQLVETRPSPLRAPLATLLEDIRQVVGGTRPAGPAVSPTPDTDPEATGGQN